MSFFAPRFGRSILIDSTNSRQKDGSDDIPTPSRTKLSSLKRPVKGEERVRKRARVEDVASSDSESGSDVEMGDVAAVTSRARRRTVFAMRNTAMMAPSAYTRYHTLPTLAILRSFVSSHKSDAFKCDVLSDVPCRSIPYACSYSNGARHGHMPHLAVAMEQGTVNILDTRKRQDWDFEPQRTLLRPHLNGIFDIKWSPDDTLIATGSGDQTARITTMASSVTSENRTLNVLHGQCSTVKCIAWDPSRNGDLLCTGGRGGSICLWDLRVGEGRHRRAAEIGDGPGVVEPVLVISGAHDDLALRSKRRSKKAASAPSVTSLLYSEYDAHSLISSGSGDGTLRLWDLRALSTSAKATVKALKAAQQPARTSAADPTTLHGARRPRGITSVAPGHGPSAGLLFARSADARVFTYSAASLEPLPGLAGPADEPPPAQPQSTSFYVRLAASPCGRWLASGSACGRAYLFDAGTAGAAAARGPGGYVGAGVEVGGQSGELSALDWAEGMLATCADDGTVRVWRPDAEVHRRCEEDSLEERWNWSWAVSSGAT
ncbi:WD40 repeat-like protein [Obba rivulosa]|uniref:WD40 repeat-like protein n=1 Tax=Obba rivulosa TaxID=1052685 RepID=A0A8E2DPW5_9APHY|nr:WD40 repeat-like protein [Obba rivulosa]